MKLCTLAFFDHIVKQTFHYSGHHGRNFVLNMQEFLGYIGVLIPTVYRPIHDERGLWSADEDVSVAWLRDFMTKKNLLEIFTWQITCPCILLTLTTR